MLSKVKKGDVVALVGFTGIRLADVEIVASSKTQLKALKKDGSEMVFDRKTGVQKNLEEGKERYANKIMLLEDAPENKPAKKREKKKAAPKKKAVEVEPEETFEDDDDFEEDDFEEDDEEFEEV